MAYSRFIRVSPRKMGIVGRSIKGLPVDKALDELRWQTSRASKILTKVIESAVANAKENNQLDPDGLKISSIMVGQGPRLKRFTPKAFGRANKIRKPTSHISVCLEGELKLTTVKPKVKAAKASPAKESTEEKPETKAAPEAAAKPKATNPGTVRRLFQRKSGM